MEGAVVTLPSPPGAASRPTAEPGPAGAPPVLRSAELFGVHKEILIEHQAQLYRLRLTSLGKLILTK
jgi:hemin uptake protein HemP